ncbi:MAG TPA: hypothetical protein VJJ22_04225 [Candidatus Paceibacterota bacterium]
MGTPKKRFDVTAFVAKQMAPTTKARWCEALQGVAEWLQPDMRLYSLLPLSEALEHETTRVGYGHFLFAGPGKHGIIKCPLPAGRYLAVPGIYASSDRGCKSEENPPKSVIYGLNRNGKWVHLAVTYDLADLQPPYNFWKIVELQFQLFQKVDDLAELLDGWECTSLMSTFEYRLEELVEHLEGRLTSAREYSSGVAELRRYLRQADSR